MQPRFSAVAAICNDAGFTVGTGFAVGPGAILTCAHVVLDALKLQRWQQEAPAAPVRFTLPFRNGGEEEFAAFADPEAWHPVDDRPRYGIPSDIALLRLPAGTAFPKNVGVARLTDGALIGAPVWIKGASTDEAIRSSLSAPTAKGHIQIDPEISGRVAQPGFSGAPVWEEANGHAVGMLISRRPTSGTYLAHAIPAALLAEATGIGLMRADPEPDDLYKDIQKSMPSVLDEGRSGMSVDGTTGPLTFINVNLDDIGRNEALGIIANSIVNAVCAPTNNKAKLDQINRRFRASKTMLENFLGIENFGVESVLYDYSAATKKDTNEIDRLVSAGIDVKAIREYGEAAIDAAAEALFGFQSLYIFKLNISGDLYRRRLFINRLISQSEKNGLLEFLEIEEIEDHSCQEIAVDKRNRLKSELISGLLSNIDFASDGLLPSELVDFIIKAIAPDVPFGAEASILSWVKKTVDEVFCEVVDTGNSRSALSPDDYAAYRMIFGFWATKNIQILYRLVALYCRTESRISTILADTIEIVSQEVFRLDINYGMQISQILSRVRQIRSGVIEPRNGLAFFEEIQNSLPDDASFEQSVCLYQISYYYFRINEKKIAKEKVMKALELDGTNVPAICFRAVIEMQDNRLEIASNLLNEAKTIDNSYIFVPFYRGVLREEEGEYDKAIIEYIRCLILAPNFYEAALNLTNCLLDAGKILDASRWATAFLSKYSVPSLEFHTNIAISLFQAGYSAQALKMLSSVYAETPAPLVALNIAKIYFGRAQAGPCIDWTDRVLESESATASEIKEAREISTMVRNRESIEMVLSAELTHVESSEEVGDALGILLASEYQLASGTNNDLFQTVRRAIQSKPRKAKKFAPKSVQLLQNAEMRKAHDRKLAEQKRRYSEQIKRGHLDSEPKSERRRRQKTYSKKMPFADGIVLTRAPSYSAG